MKKKWLSFLVVASYIAYVVFQRQAGADHTAMTAAPEAVMPASPSAPPPSQAPPAPSPSAPPAPPADPQLQWQAQGTVLITNHYPSSLTLLKTTRLLTPDGKLYRLAEAVVLPAGGQVRAQVYADQNGAIYAIGPSAFSIPGLTANLQAYVTVVSDSAFAMAQPIMVTADAAPPSPQPKPPSIPPPPAPKPKGQYRDGTYNGDSADAYYGNVQVAAVIRDGKISDVQFLDYPHDRGTSVRINTQAMPFLKSEAIQAQNANVDIVSGATQSSGAFRESLASALAQARF